MDPGKREREGLSTDIYDVINDIRFVKNQRLDVKLATFYAK